MDGYPPAVLLDAPTVAVVAVVAAATAVLALGLCLSLVLRFSRLRVAYDALVDGDPDASFATAVRRQSAGIEGIRTDLLALRADVTAARADLSDALRHVAVVRYDAFGDMGGRMSFSAALLDDAGDGLVLTSINGRSETRTYAKGISGGVSEHALSPEEEEAIDRATRARPGRGVRSDLAGAAPRRRP